ncbi:MAG: carbohydrate ABC transporter permease [Lachnospiraceae bacterium]|nr:carbohydrate ABC transporter permease [Lachnospiraceae bacterium]MEE0282594.1 carbohydrate ABC transporter permease [Lachnospiraceae bacterium]
MKSKRMHISDKIINILLILLAMLFLIPFYFVIVNSFKSMNEITADNVALPTSLNLDNFKQALSSIRYGQSLLNTFLITFFSNVGWILIAPMGAYYIGRIDNKFCKFLFTLIIASMSIPFQAVMIPMVVVGTMFHLINNIPGVIIIYVGLAIPFAVFMCTGALRYIPREIEESAYIDGATQFQTFWKIVFPMMQSTIVTVTILNTFWFWNDFILPQILLQNKNARTLQLAIYQLFGENVYQWNIIMPALLLAILPIVIFFILMQNKIVEGVAAGAVKS